MDENYKIALFIPTYNAMTECDGIFTKNLTIIKQANLNEVLIIDSSSIDSTVATINSFGFKVKVISKDKFDHGGTRTEAFKILSFNNDFIIFLTQDTLLLDTDSLKNLIQPMITDSLIAGVYGKQLPHPDADLFAMHLRSFNYSNVSYVRSYSDRFIYGIKCAFSSNSFAAYRTDALKHINGFSEHLIMGEDMYVFAKFLQANFKVAYEAKAICFHSHNYSIKEEFKRYFDIGVFHRTENWVLRDFGGPDKYGIKYFISELRFLGLRFYLWPKLFLKTIAKYVGYKLGYHFDIIGVVLCRKFSCNTSFWW
ncbi:MAG: glycosyltransferase family 2 protein [Neisseriaceae bacterium]|jgi:rhamnosyltransferase